MIIAISIEKSNLSSDVILLAEDKLGNL